MNTSLNSEDKSKNQPSLEGVGEDLDIHVAPLEADLEAVVATLALKPRSIKIATGAGRLEKDLQSALEELYGPHSATTLNKLSRRVGEIVYPLAANLKAQAIELVITTGTNIPVPSKPDTYAVYVTFDLTQDLIHHCFLSPRHELTNIYSIHTPRGLAILGTPINYNYHTLQDDRGISPRNGAENLREWDDRNRDKSIEPDGVRLPLVTPSPIPSMGSIVSKEPAPTQKAYSTLGNEVLPVLAVEALSEPKRPLSSPEKSLMPSESKATVTAPPLTPSLKTSSSFDESVKRVERAAKLAKDKPNQAELELRNMKFNHQDFAALKVEPTTPKSKKILRLAPNGAKANPDTGLSPKIDPSSTQLSPAEQRKLFNKKIKALERLFPGPKMMPGDE